MNWGKQPIILLMLFCMILMYSIYQINRKVRTDMVSENYVAEAQNYQMKIEAIQRTKKDSSFRMAKADPFVVVELPIKKFKNGVKGEIFFYCAYNADLDKKIQLATDAAGQQLIPQSWLSAKAYTIKMSWVDGGKTFYDEKNLLLK
ncbi:MAG: FixH family protein [Sediminibacterium sp. Gen4]|jgi:predicted pyridoxine 5'-phosphate oxidase superfamily flavin-nucleotide-binding protein|uniref:FixH family protein n=1 Tax=unclassified Sediminibacterium TaxID=2635961 RepID=UPI0015C17321|nr:MULTISPECIES: FixH family protein [unclassified Sediminibacterium]MBW0161554.1 FixH family protein [Sediminibacterium sp.]MBW0163926.1 FixH family protein [Sediminibacterium sp.]NWK65851.1 FixH family protein [Sediminibacterium sp. Gen4]